MSTLRRIGRKIFGKKRQNRRKKSSQTISLPYLPEIIMEEIFHKLPYNAMTRSKLVCKTWNSIISSPKFIDDRYYRHRLENNHLIFLDDRELTREFNLYTSSYSNLVDDTFFLLSIKPFDKPIPWGLTRPNLIGSYNGLIAISWDCRLILWNPLTKNYVSDDVRLYDSRTNFGSRFLFGLCYDGNKDEYSVVVASEYQSPMASPSDFDDVDYDDTSVFLYNFKDGSARNISFKRGSDEKIVRALDSRLLDMKLFDGGVGRVVCGVPHWVVKRYDFKDPWVKTDILYFDLNEEKFKLMDKPDGGGEKIIIGLTMLDGENQLGCVLHDVVDECLDVWVMKEYGKTDSWSNMLRLSYVNIVDTLGYHVDYMDVMGVLPSRELLIYLNDSEFLAYSIERGDFRKIKLQGLESSSVVIYQPKLIIPPTRITKRVNEARNDINECEEYEDDDEIY